MSKCMCDRDLESCRPDLRWQFDVTFLEDVDKFFGCYKKNTVFFRKKVSNLQIFYYLIPISCVAGLVLNTRYSGKMENKLILNKRLLTRA